MHEKNKINKNRETIKQTKKPKRSYSDEKYNKTENFIGEI